MWCMSAPWRPIQADMTLSSSGLFCPRCVARERCAFHRSGLEDLDAAEGRRRGFALLELLLKPEPRFACSRVSASCSQAGFDLSTQDLAESAGPFEAEHRHHVGVLLVDSCFSPLEDASTDAASSDEPEGGSVCLDDSDACSEGSRPGRPFSVVGLKEHAEAAPRKGRAIQNAPLAKNMPAGVQGVHGLNAVVAGGGA